ncbi:hypothetical protein M409DRAFT_21962 [Zasmidium cellare ATCC 36951]|uniref:G-protein coupled receptors family 2 profile 2 domain-containing protein n=1 Tax=Zasmidium cellare ATCC 36951 TaxID=1080233 RepID=A0A6A6CKZ5_ZASCE|nr:uncharacterized protein M409DRAFT_21962 [Zasmidium cellare ATCC 36951]KAF2167815.1 hypothetical protein M409DRAFT_21962 [Zasmidium cellare ATCC 36951]
MADLESLSALGCPMPFVSDTQVPYTVGELAGRFCGNITQGLACCLPCPIEDWIYSDNFSHNLSIAYWFNVPALVLQVFLLVTFAVLPKEVSHRHHLSVGLCVVLIMAELSFIIPLGTKPSLCYDEITPGDMYTSMSCAWSGALLVTGAMGCAVWIMLRSLWTHLRVCWDVKQTTTLFLLTQATGWGLPGLFLALCIPITGVSYRIGATCVPNQKNAFVTWFGWLIAFACIAALLQFVTTFFCLWLYLKDVLWGKGGSPLGTNDTTTTTSQQDRTLAWRRVRKVLSLQWRSIVLTTLVIIESVYFGVVFIHETSTADRLSSNSQADEILEWAFCLVRNEGRKDRCLNITKVLGLSEESILASFFLAALIGLLTFTLMLRRSMLQGWSTLLFHPRQRRPSIGEQDFIILSPKRRSFGRQLESEKSPPQHQHQQQPHQPYFSAHPSHSNLDSRATPFRRDGPLLHSPVSPITPTGVLPDDVATPVGEQQRTLSVPQAGEVDRRHETTNWFDDEEDEEDGRRRGDRSVSKLDDFA